jgi:hypothetical protein
MIFWDKTEPVSPKSKTIYNDVVLARWRITSTPEDEYWNCEGWHFLQIYSLNEMICEQVMEEKKNTDYMHRKFYTNCKWNREIENNLEVDWFTSI